MTALSRVLAALARLVRKEPARVAAVCTVLLGWAAAAGVPAGVVGSVSTLLAAVLGIGLRAAVVPVATAAQAVVDGAVAAASQAVARVDQTAAGAVGEITADGTAAVTGAVQDAVAVVLDGTGLNPKGRKVHITEGVTAK